MPNRDGTGPGGKGARTGRGVGNCAPKDNEGTRGVGRRTRSKGAGRGRK